MKLTIQNCNNISNGSISVKENSLNIKYAINGTGKSSIAKLIEASIKNDSEAIKRLIPYNSSDTPKITGLENIHKVMIFNEEYVNQYLFQKDKLLDNAFNVFVKTENYEEQMRKIEDLLENVNKKFVDHQELNKLIDDLGAFISGYGNAAGLSKAGSIYKGLGKGNKIDNIPSDLLDYKEYLTKRENGSNVKWLKWMSDGKGYLPIAQQCPYCCSKDKKAQERINKVYDIYDSKSVEHLNKVLELIDGLMPYFSNATKEKITKISSNADSMEDEDISFLKKIKEQISELYDCLKKIRELNFYSLKDNGRLDKYLTKLKIDISLFNCLNSEDTQSKIDVVNSSLEEVKIKFIELQQAISRQKELINKTVKAYQKQINNFFECAGYKYEVSIELNNENDTKLLLKPRLNEETSSIENIRSHLSYGEKNAFALVLFVYTAIREKPDLIVFDDPISSFDGNKKFAILDMLFLNANTLKGNTILMLSHDFSIVVDVIKSLAEKFDNTVQPTAYFLTNHEGTLQELEIKKEDICSYIQVMMNNVNDNINVINKIVYLRRYYEVHGEKGDEWDVLSNVIHKRENPTCINPRNGEKKKMTKKSFYRGCKRICNIITEFNYNEVITILLNKERMKDIYRATTSNYEKMQLYRIIKDDEMKHLNKVIKKFIDETFHVENDYIFQLNPRKFETVPQYIIQMCDKEILGEENKAI